MLLKRKGPKVRRNDPCPCGSGLKYKKCCMATHPGEAKSMQEKYLREHRIRLKGESDVAAIRRAGALAVRTLDLVETHVKPGISTDEINALVHEFTIKNGAIPAPLHYRGFPKSVCVSINEQICHGIPGRRVIQEGDIVNVDVTPILDGYYADASKTYFAGTPGPDALKIVNVARECLKAGIKMARPGNRVGDIG